MRILLINSVCGTGSTGRICRELARMAEERGHEAVIAYGRGGGVPQLATYRIGTGLDVGLHGLKTRLFDAHGFGSKKATEEFIEWMKNFAPDIVHLHNIHGYYLHIGVLFEALKELGVPILWTLHDCWAFTGHCAHYAPDGCEKWKDGCHHCGMKREYPGSLLWDRSGKNYEIKKRLFNLPRDMTLVAPSRWLAEQAGQSFLRSYPVRVIGNGIDLCCFAPAESDLRVRCGLGGKKVALGVADRWTEQKGLGYMLDLPARLGSGWQVVLVGLTRQQKRRMPPEILALEKILSPRELARWYTAADVFVSPSEAEAMGLTAAEAIACGTPVVAFDTTAAAETVGESGILVPCGDMDGLSGAVKRAVELGKDGFRYDRDRFDGRIQYEKYMQLYEQLKEKTP